VELGKVFLRDIECRQIIFLSRESGEVLLSCYKTGANLEGLSRRSSLDSVIHDILQVNEKKRHALTLR
jgi:hypothetical protein